MNAYPRIFMYEYKQPCPKLISSALPSNSELRILIINVFEKYLISKCWYYNYVAIYNQFAFEVYLTFSFFKTSLLCIYYTSIYSWQNKAVIKCTIKFSLKTLLIYILDKGDAACLNIIMICNFAKKIQSQK